MVQLNFWINENGDNDEEMIYACLVSYADGRRARSGRLLPVEWQSSC